MITTAQNLVLNEIFKYQYLNDIFTKEAMIQNITYQEERESFLNVQSLQDGSTKGKVQNLESIQDTIYGLSACKFASQTAIFDLKGIAEGFDIKANNDDQQVVEKNAGINTVLFNFCEMKINDLAQIQEQCSQVNDGAFAYGYQSAGELKCTPILKTADGKPNTLASDIREGNTEDVNGIKLTFETGASTCPSDPSKQLSLDVEVRCVKDQTTLMEDAHDFTDPCAITLKYTSDQGCPKFQYGILAKFLTQYSFLFGAIMIVFGLILAFCGNKFLTVVISLVTALAVFVFGVYLTAMFVDAVFKPENVWEYSVWVILGIWVIIGIIAGIFIGKKRKWGIAVVGAFGGVMLGLLLTTVFGTLITSAWVYYLIIISCGILAFLIAFKVEKFVLIIATSFIGSYFVVRGISMYAGGFPNETQLHTMAKEGFVDWNTFPKIFFAYLAGIFVMTIGTAVFQFKTNKDADEKQSMRRKY